MKKFSYLVGTIALLAFSGACNNDDLPEANFSLFQAEGISVAPGDREVSLSWVPAAQGTPEEYYISWAAGTAGIEGGNRTVGKDVTSLKVENLVNGVTYTFSVQARYGQGLSGKISATAKPVTSRYEVRNLVASAGSKAVRLTWDTPEPETERLKGYKVVVMPGDRTVEISDAAAVRTAIDQLTDGTEYTFTMHAVYTNGESDGVSASATPGNVFPILMSESEPAQNQPVTFTANDMYFLQDEIASVLWQFDDGQVSEELSPVHRYSATGSYNVSVKVTYKNGKTEAAIAQLTVVSFKYASVALKYDTYVAAVKASNPVFSPDGSTFYVPTSNKQGHLFAVDAYTGVIKWVYEITGNVTYGGGAAVGPDGTIFQGGRDKTMHAITPEGKKKWSFEASGNIDAFPAVTSDNILYFCANGAGSATAYARKGDTGEEIWTKTLDGATGSAAAVDAEGNVYFGTSAAIYSFTPSGSQRWKTSEALNVTGNGSFALGNGVLYAALTGGSGIAAVDMSNGAVKWKVAGTANGDAYFPVVGPDGSVYFTDKGAKTIHALTSSGSVKWEKNVEAVLIYGGLALSSDGKLYVGSQGKAASGSYLLLGVDAANGNLFLNEASGDQIMSAFTIGPDSRLYYGTVQGNVFARELSAGLETSSWSMRGGNYQGTNSLK